MGWAIRLVAAVLVAGFAAGCAWNRFHAPMRWTELGVSGIVKDQAGNPVAKATVWAQGNCKEKLTDSRGRFRITARRLDQGQSAGVCVLVREGSSPQPLNLIYPTDAEVTAHAAKR